MSNFVTENERFPVELGWVRRSESVDLELITSANTAIGNYTSLLTTATPVVTDKRRALIDSHFASPKFAM